MKTKIIFFILLLSNVSFAQELQHNSPAVVELASHLGIDGMISSTIQQTKEAFDQTSQQVTLQLKKQSPNMTEEEEKKINHILNKYLTSVLDSIDPQKASDVYITTLSEKLTKSEIEEANSFYKTEDGKRILSASQNASKALNEYLLTNINNATIKYQNVMMQELASLRKPKK